MRQPLPTATALLACVFLLGQAAAAAPPARDGFSCGDVRVRVNRFFPKEKGRRPAVILLHGIDGLQENGEFYRAVAERLKALGYVAVVVYYHDRTATKKEDLPGLLKRFRADLDDPRPQAGRWKDVDGTFALWLEAVEAGVADGRAHPRVDAERVALVGFSLGGFLATSAAARSEGRVRCVVSLFGGLPQPLQKSAAKMPPALLIHGDADEVVPVRETQALAALLKQNDRSCEAKVYREAGHLFVQRDGKVDWLAAYDAERRSLAFLSRHLSGDRTK